MDNGKRGFEGQFDAPGIQISNDIDLLLTLEEPSRSYPAGDELIRTGDTVTAFYVLHEGWACSCRLLADGQRQILEFFLPGQIMGMQDLASSHALNDLLALTDISASAIPHHRIHDAFSDSPNLSERLFHTMAQEQAIVNERLINIGRRSSAQRLAHFFLEMQFRLNRSGRSYQLPSELNQSIIGDALGMTSVHVSRTLKELRTEGLIEFHDNHVTLLQPKALAMLAEFDDSYLHLHDN